MQAMTFARYGGPEVLRLRERERPEPRRGEVLVRMLASSINASDVRLLRADPFLVRLENGLFTPRRQVPGTDLAGIVEEVGRAVTGLGIGDAVFGHCSRERGAWSEYVRVPAEAVTPLPEGLDFEPAAAVVLAGLTALQAVRQRARIRPGQSVLIQGAGGGVGTLLVQIARAYGATVTAVCGPGSRELVGSLSADRVIDYTRQDFTDEAERYDAIFGVNGYYPLPAYRDHLRPGGTYVMVGGTNRQIFEALLFGPLRFAGSHRNLELLRLDPDLHPRDLAELRERITEGSLRPVIDRVVSLAEIPEAIRYVERGHVRGKVVVRAASP